MQLTKLNVQSLLQLNEPPLYAAKVEHNLPSRLEPSHCSMKLAEFGFWTVLSPQKDCCGLEQELESYLQVLVHFNVPEEKPNDAHVLPFRSEPSQLSVIWFTESSPHVAFGGSGCLAMHLSKLKVQSLLQLNDPLENALKDVQVFPSRSTESHCSIKPAEFGLCMNPSPQIASFGLLQELGSYLQVLVHFSVPEEKPNVEQVLLLRSVPSQLSITWFTEPSPHVAAGALAMQLSKLNVQSFLHPKLPPENALKDVHNLLSRFVLSHSSIKLAEFGFWTVLSPQKDCCGLEQELESYLQVLVHLSVPEEKPNVEQVLLLKSVPSHSSVCWLTELSPQAGPAGCFKIHASKFNVQSLLQLIEPPMYALNEVHDFPSKLALSHCSLNPAEFGFWTLLSPQKAEEGLPQTEPSYLQVLVHFNVPEAKPNEAQVLPSKSVPSQLSVTWLTEPSPQVAAGAFAMQLTKLNVQSLLQLNEPPLYAAKVEHNLPSRLEPSHCSMKLAEFGFWTCCGLVHKLESYLQVLVHFNVPEEKPNEMHVFPLRSVRSQLSLTWLTEASPQVGFVGTGSGSLDMQLSKFNVQSLLQLMDPPIKEVKEVQVFPARLD